MRNSRVINRIPRPKSAPFRESTVLASVSKRKESMLNKPIFSAFEDLENQKGLKKKAEEAKKYIAMRKMEAHQRPASASAVPQEVR